MRRIFNLFNFILFISITCNSTICAQKGALFVKKDSLISKVVELNKKINLEIYEKDYYVIQLYYGDYEIAQNVLKEFSTNVPANLYPLFKIGFFKRENIARIWFL